MATKMRLEVLFGTKSHLRKKRGIALADCEKEEFD